MPRWSFTAVAVVYNFVSVLHVCGEKILCGILYQRYDSNTLSCIGTSMGWKVHLCTGLELGDSFLGYGLLISVTLLG